MMLLCKRSIVHQVHKPTGLLLQERWLPHEAWQTVAAQSDILCYVLITDAFGDRMRNAAALAEQFLSMNLTPEAVMPRRHPQSMAKPGAASQQTRNRQPSDVRLQTQKSSASNSAQTKLPAPPERRHQQSKRLPQPPSTTQQHQLPHRRTNWKPASHQHRHEGP